MIFFNPWFSVWESNLHEEPGHREACGVCQGHILCDCHSIRGRFITEVYLSPGAGGDTRDAFTFWHQNAHYITAGITWWCIVLIQGNLCAKTTPLDRPVVVFIYTDLVFIIQVFYVCYVVFICRWSLYASFYCTVSFVLFIWHFFHGHKQSDPGSEISDIEGMGTLNRIIY